MKQLLKVAAKTPLRLFCCTVAMATAACSGGRAPLALTFVLDSSGRTAVDSLHTFAMDSTGVTQAGLCRKRDTVDDSAHAIAASMREFLISNAYCNWVVPENHDEQRFRVKQGAYGPFVHTVATPWIWGYRDHQPFDKYWVNVAVIDVDAPGGTLLPSEYTSRLHLKAGHNCLFLHYEALPTPTWQAAMVEPPAGSCIPAAAGPPAQPLAVVVDAPSADYRDYPAVTRFMEGVNGDTYVGVRCGNAWCIAGAPTMAAVAPASQAGTPMVSTSSRWRISGWFDDQHLAVPTTKPGAPDGLAPGGAASAIPVDNLARIPFAAFSSGWPMVATVYLAGNPVGKYASTVSPGYGFKPGPNPVWLHAVVVKTHLSGGGLKIDTLWGARIGHAPSANDQFRTPGVRTLRVIRTDHTLEGFPVPGTARWRWVTGDEQLWTACMIGCCRVQPEDLQ